MVVDRTGRYAGTLGNEGYTYATLMCGALGALQQAVAIEPCRVSAALLVRTVVRGEDNQGILVEALFLQFVENLTYLLIQTVHHSGKLCMPCIVAIVPRTEVAAIGTVLPLEALGVLCHQAVVGLPQFGMGQGVGKDAHEGFLLRLAVNPFQCILVDEVAGILFPVLIVLVARCHVLVENVLLQRVHHHMPIAILLGVVSVQEVWIVGMRLELADVAIIAIHTTPVGQGGTAALCALGSIGVAVGIEQVGIGVLHVIVSSCPLAEHTRSISSLLHYFRDNLMVQQVWFLAYDTIVGIVAKGVLPQCPMPVLPVAAHMGVTRVLTGHERSTRWCTHRTAGIGLGKAHALLCHTVKVGSLYQLLTIATKVAIAHVIAHDEDNVRALCWYRFIFRLRHCAACHSHGRHHSQCRHQNFSNLCHKIFLVGYVDQLFRTKVPIIILTCKQAVQKHFGATE